MRRILLALMLVISWAAWAHAAGYGSDSSPPARLTALQTWAAPPSGTMYSVGGYAPADPISNATGDPNLIDKSEVASPVGGCPCNGGGGGYQCNSAAGCDCIGLWDGYLARPCQHRHHLTGYGHGHGCWKKCFGGSQCGCAGGCNTCAPSQSLPCNSGCGWGGGCGGGCGGGWGSGYAYSGAAYIAPGCGCVPTCRTHHCCKLLHCWKKKCGGSCGCGEVASCGCGNSCGCAGDGGVPADGGPPQPALAPEQINPAPAPAPEPGPSAQRPRAWRSMAAMGGLLNN
jgi:hypothetical protein